MTSKAAVEDFVGQRALAIVGVSRDARKFGRLAYKTLKGKGYRVFAVNRNAERIDGDRCYPDLHSLPERVDGAVIVVPPTESEQVVRAAAEVGIRRVWLQQGAESASAIRFCQEHGISEVHGECILMFTQPTSYHRLHRWAWAALGKLPR